MKLAWPMQPGREKRLWKGYEAYLAGRKALLARQTFPVETPPAFSRHKLIHWYSGDNFSDVNTILGSLIILCWHNHTCYLLSFLRCGIFESDSGQTPKISNVGWCHGFGLHFHQTHKFKVDLLRSNGGRRDVDSPMQRRHLLLRAIGTHNVHLRTNRPHIVIIIKSWWNCKKTKLLNHPAGLALDQGSPADRHRHRTTPPSFIFLIGLNNLFPFQSITQTTHYHQNTDHNHDHADRLSSSCWWCSMKQE